MQKKSIRENWHANIDVHIRILIAEFSGDGIKCIEKLQSHCANMTFADKSRYDITFQKVTHKVGGSAINNINRLQNAQDLSVLLGNTYSEYQLMQTFLDKFHQGGKYSSQIASHQAELNRVEKCTDQKSLSISFLFTDYLNLDSISGCGINIEGANNVQTKCTFCGDSNNYAEFFFKSISEEKEKSLYGQ